MRITITLVIATLFIAMPLSGCGADQCSTDRECSSGERCSDSGGILFGSKICISGRVEDIGIFDADPSHADANDADPTDADPTDADPTDADPTDADPTDAEPTDAEPTDGGQDVSEQPDVEDPDTDLGDANGELATVLTYSVESITASSAVIHGHVANDGGTPVTERGFCWGIDPMPDVDNDTCTIESAGTGDIISDLQPLLAATTYHVRAYATNDLGTAYGAQRIFETLD